MKKWIMGILATVCACACVGTFAADSVEAAAATLTYETMVEKDTPPESYLALEEVKVKNMTEWGYYTVDGEDVWYFMGDGTATANPEIRFVTEGTDTSKKINGSYTFAPVDVQQFSFEYRIVNDDPKAVADLGAYDYIVQVLASDSTYPITTPEITADGEWHKITIDGDTLIYNHNNDWYYRQVSHLFSGFIFKMGGLEGEFMIKNISVVLEGEEVPEEPETPDNSSGSNSSNNSNSANGGTTQQPNSSTNNGQSGGAENSDSQSSGCASTVGGALTVGVLLAAGGLLLKKKED